MLASQLYCDVATLLLLQGMGARRVILISQPSCDAITLLLLRGMGARPRLDGVHHVLQAMRAALVRPLLLTLGDRPQPVPPTATHTIII